jgi:hypothetical protein
LALPSTKELLRSSIDLSFPTRPLRGPEILKCKAKTDSREMSAEDGETDDDFEDDFEDNDDSDDDE